MSAAILHTVQNNSFWLSHSRCIFWEEEKALILSDLHFGKTGHFRKSGIAVPQNVFKEDLQRLFAQIQFYQPKQLIIAGDLFHSEENKEMDLFLRWRNDIAHIPVQLIKGNHDILKNEWYNAAGISVSGFRLHVAGFSFIHDIDTFDKELKINSGETRVSNYTFSGHIHPGISIKSNGRQSLCFPCFYFGETYAVLPAYSRFTGLALVKPKKNEFAFAIVNQSVMAVK